MMSAVTVIVGLIFVCLIAGFGWWAAQQLLRLVTVAEPFATFLRILLGALVLLAVLWALTILLGLAGIHVPSMGSLVK
jgi:hypothetical protein